MSEEQRVVLEVARKRYDDQAFIAYLEGVIDMNCVEGAEDGRRPTSVRERVIPEIVFWEV